MAKNSHDFEYISAIRESTAGGMKSFQSWFNGSDNVNQAAISGYWDMAIHILTPTVCKYISQPDSMTALEIGYGGGRILNAACGFFGQVYGVDIHQEQSYVEDFLHSQSHSNFTLLHLQEGNIDLPPESIDLIYSFIVLQHLDNIGEFINYLKESSRLLRPDGIAQLYFGNLGKLSVGSRIRHFLIGYREIPDTQVNHTSLVISIGKAARIARSLELKVIDRGHSYKRAPDGFPDNAGGQSYITVLKR